jgi:hypothetical protein
MDFASSTVFSSAVNGAIDGNSVVVVVGTFVVLTSAMGTTLNVLSTILVIVMML